MDPTRVSFFVELLNAFKSALGQATTLIYPWVFVTLSFFALLELLLSIARGLQSGTLGKHLVGYGVRLVLLGWAIGRWEWLFTLVIRQGIDMGLYMAGGTLTSAQFLNPGAYYQLGLDMSGILLEQWNTSALAGMVDVVVSPVLTFGYFLAWVVFTTCFAIMALVIFIVQIEQAFALPTLLVLLPFLLCKQTGWIGQGTVTYMVRLAYRFLMLALIVGIVKPVTETMTLPKPDIRQAAMLACGAVTFLICFLKGSSMAANILNGVMMLGGGSVAEAGALLLSTLQAGKAAALDVGRRGWNATGAALDVATAERMTLPTIPPPRPSTPQLHSTLVQAGRAMHG
jgi:type IV secretion system protein TrbL